MSGSVLVWSTRRCDVCGQEPQAPLQRIHDATGWYCVPCYRALQAAATTALTREARAFVHRQIMRGQKPKAPCANCGGTGWVMRVRPGARHPQPCHACNGGPSGAVVSYTVAPLPPNVLNTVSAGAGPEGGKEPNAIAARGAALPSDYDRTTPIPLDAAGAFPRKRLQR